MRKTWMPTTVSFISAKALSGVPQFVLSELGEKGLTKTFSAAGLPMRFLEQRNGYIPELAAGNFILETARLLGQDQLGLLLSPSVSIRDYGVWGEYILSAPTLETALLRLVDVLPYHANGGRISVRICKKTVIFSYQDTLNGHKSYPIIGHLTLAILLDVLKQFVQVNWVPDQILINLPKPTGAENVEEHYGCPVYFDSEVLAVVFSTKELKATNIAPGIFTKASVQDIARERASGPPINLVESVRSILFQQLIDHDESLDNVAKMLDTGTRRLQRALEREGTSYRRLASQVTMERATELLGMPGESVSSVATELGYSDHANFSRAFKKETGRPPGLLLCK